MSHVSRTSSMVKRHFGSIRKLPSGRYQAHYTDRQGARVLAPSTFARRGDAEAWLVDVRRAADRGLWQTLQAPGKVRFADYVGPWLEQRQVAGRPIRQRTRDHYRYLLDAHILPTFGHRWLGDITPAMVRNWYSKTLTDKPTARAHTYALLKAIMAAAMDDELTQSNPCRIRGAGTAARAGHTVPATPTELRALAAGMPDRLALTVALGGWCGLRFGEATELRRKDVDVDGEVIHVRRAVSRTSGGYVAGDTKSLAGQRSVAVPPHVMPEIVWHLDNFTGSDRDALLFPADHGGHLAPATYWRWWDKARQAAGRPDLRFHDLRHTAGTMTATSGATLRETMARLGHSSPGAALRYQHASDARAREIADRLSKLADT